MTVDERPSTVQVVSEGHWRLFTSYYREAHQIRSRSSAFVAENGCARGNVKRRTVFEVNHGPRQVKLRNFR
jgi:hypothetical protein